MLAIISPAKSLDFSPVNDDVPLTTPQFTDEAIRLATAARRLSKARLRAMMDLSEPLTELNYQRFKAFRSDPDIDETRPAAFCFAGDTYAGLDFKGLGRSDQAHAQDHLRILSGLYGVLRPLDRIQPYRLEMGRRLKTRRGETLYDFWGDLVAAALKAQAERINADHVVNLASTEYFRSVRLKALDLPVITPVFLDESNGRAKVISFFAKRARGAMARFIIEHRITDPRHLAGFTWEDYSFQSATSSQDAPIFLRKAAAAA